MPAKLEFWFEFASTYSYLAAARIAAKARAAQLQIAWRPFLLGPIFQAQGWTDSPFNIYPAKGRYMWRDMERQCAELGLPLRRPSRFPRNGLLAARVALVAADQGWADRFVPAVYRVNFAEDGDIADPAVIGPLIGDVGHDVAAVLKEAGSDENKQRLRNQSARAAELGIFGAPSFIVGTELFWGNDRLEQAIAWAKRG